MVEVEMKFPVPDFRAVEQRLARWAASPEGARHDTDHYFNAPDRDFARTDEALRVRSAGDANYLTYKGPKRDAQTKTRTEVEIPLGPGKETAEALRQLLAHLGYRPSGTVDKDRRRFHLERDGFPLEVCLDEVAGLGSFVEMEVVTSEDAVDRARETLMACARELGLWDTERRSYLELLLEQGKA